MARGLRGGACPKQFNTAVIIQEQTGRRTSLRSASQDSRSIAAPRATFCPFTSLASLQREIQTYHPYNDTGLPTINTSKEQTLRQVMTAAATLRRGVPIQCVEATYLALLRTESYPREFLRFSISFKLLDDQGVLHKHLVLGVSYQGLFGGVGISREPELASKPMTHRSLYALLCSYNSHGRPLGETVCVRPYRLLCAKLGAPIGRTLEAMERVPVWHHTLVSFRRVTQARRDVDHFEQRVLMRRAAEGEAAVFM